MSATPQEELDSFTQSVFDFAAESLNVDIEERLRSGIFRRDLWEACAKFGILKMPLPASFGGSEKDIMATVRAMEALGRGCLDQGLLFALHAHMWAVLTPILHFGTEQQKEKYLRPLSDGTLIGAHGISEPESGSDAFSMSTHAESTESGYILNGKKALVTSAPIADVFLVFATVNPKLGMWGVTAFLIDRGTPGLSLSEPRRKMGLTTAQMGDITFENCEVGKEAVLGTPGQGGAIFNHSMAWERSCILASQVGAMARQVEKCVERAKSRKQFGRPIGDFQLVAARIADMKVRLEVSRLVLYHAAQTVADGKGGEGLASAVAKLFISESAVASALEAVETFGGYGFLEEYGVERDLRDFLGGTLYSGTSDIQRLLIARQLGLRPS